MEKLSKGEIIYKSDIILQRMVMNFKKFSSKLMTRVINIKRQ